MPLGCNSSTLGQSAEPLAPARTSRRDTAYRRRYGRTVPHTAAQTRASVREDPLSRRHLLLGPLLTLGLATLAAEDCEAIGIPDILSPGLKKQLGESSKASNPGSQSPAADLFFTNIHAETCSLFSPLQSRTCQLLPSS